MPNVNNAAIVPSSQQPISDRQGRVTTPWQRFFNALVAAPSPIEAVTVTASPFTYRAGATGFLNISGGTVSSVQLTRNTTTITSNTPVSVTNGDLVIITYSVLPTVHFVPS